MRLLNLNLTEVCNAEIDVFKITGLASKNEIEYGELVSGGTYDAYETDDCFQPGVAIDGIREFHIMSGEGDIKSVDQDWHYAVDNVSRVIFSVIRNGKRFVVNEPLECYIKEYDGRIVFDVTEFAEQAGYSEETVQIPVNKSIWCDETPPDFVYGTGNGVHFYRASDSFESGDFYFEDGTFTVDGETVSELHWQYSNDFNLEKAEHPENNCLLDKVCACSSNELLIKLKPRDGAELSRVFLTTKTATYCYIPDGVGGFRKLNFAEDFFVPAVLRVFAAGFSAVSPCSASVFFL